ncbi:MAG: hypothetical protein KatS3mg031_0861 [Chitinophagales bacterium]|nr:MAG: hypothetical protein KatS3mg031_0861 [Chitinophagales bacterium]
MSQCSGTRSGFTLRFIAYAGFAYLLAILLFSLHHYREILIADGAFMVFEMCNTAWFPQAQNRLIILILDVLPVLAVNLNFSLKAVILSWILNYFIFYTICFGITALVLKDFLAAGILLATYAFTLSACFYNVANEIQPAAVLAVTAFSAIRNRGMQSIWRYVIYVMIFFIAFSHPLVGVALFLTAIWLTLWDYSSVVAALKKYYLLVLVFSSMLVLRMILATQNTYESFRLQVSPEMFTDFLTHLNFHYLRATAHFMLSAFPTLTVLLFSFIAIQLYRRAWRTLTVCLILTFAYTVVWFFYVNPQTPWLLNRYDHLTIRWYFPAAFLVVVSFFRTITTLPEQTALRKGFNLLLIVLLLFQLYWLHGTALLAQNTVRQYELLFAAARQQEGSKFYIPEEATCRWVYRSQVFVSSLVYSALAAPDSSLHIIIANTAHEKPVLQNPSDKILLSRNYSVSVYKLNKNYFKLHSGPYRRLETDLSECTGMPPP